MRKDEFPLIEAYADSKVDEALDKIRAEIKKLDVYYDNDYFVGNRDAMFKCNEVLHILNKYKIETEVEE